MMEYSRISEDVTSLMSENETVNQFEAPLSSEGFPNEKREQNQLVKIEIRVN